MTISCFRTFLIFSQSYIFNFSINAKCIFFKFVSFLFSFVFVLLFVAVVVTVFVAVVIVVILYCFYLPIYYTGCI